MFARVRQAFSHRHDPVIRPHIGQVIDRKLLLAGRVLREGALLPATAATPRWRNLLNTYHSFVHGKIAGARLLATFGSRRTEVRTDGDGYFSVEMDLPARVTGPLWQKVHFSLIDAPGHRGPTPAAEGLVLVHPLESRYGVISDVDDTVLSSNVTRRFRMILTVLLSNAHTRLPFAGVGALYRALERGQGDEHNPIFYVSNGPWNLHDLLVEFFRVNDIPLGPIHLRDWGTHLVLARKPTGTHKRARISHILHCFPKMPVVLIGDSGEHDPEIFGAIAQEFPGRVAAIYIRCVHRDPRRREQMASLEADMSRAGVDFLLVADSEEAAVHAASKGLIPMASVEAVRRDKRANEQRTGGG
jgi:phosphatidate phosphatase APP1